MKRWMMFAAIVVLVAVVVAVPAMAHDGHAFNGDAFDLFNSDTFNRVFDGFNDSRGNNGSSVGNGFFNGSGGSDRLGNSADSNHVTDSRFDNNRSDDPSVSQAIGQESESGDVAINSSVTGSGNNSNQCVTPLQFGNTGSLQNAQGVLQYGSESGDIELEGSSFVFAPSLNAKCDQKVQQSAAASSN